MRNTRFIQCSYCESTKVSADEILRLGVYSTDQINNFMKDTNGDVVLDATVAVSIMEVIPNSEKHNVLFSTTFSPLEFMKMTGRLEGVKMEILDQEKKFIHKDDEIRQDGFKPNQLPTEIKTNPVIPF